MAYFFPRRAAASRRVLVADGSKVDPLGHDIEETFDLSLAKFQAADRQDLEMRQIFERPQTGDRHPSLVEVDLIDRPDPCKVGATLVRDGGAV